MKLDSSGVRFYFVWVPVLETDTVAAAQEHASAEKDARVSHFWDAKQELARSYATPLRAREGIRAGARRAVERASAGALAPYDGEPSPYEIEVEMRTPLPDSLRENLAKLPEFLVEGERRIRTVAQDMDIGFRRIAYLGFGHLPGVTRY